MSFLKSETEFRIRLRWVGSTCTVEALGLPGVGIKYLEDPSNGQRYGRESHFAPVAGNKLAIEWKGEAARPADLDAICSQAASRFSNLEVSAVLTFVAALISAILLYRGTVDRRDLELFMDVAKPRCAAAFDKPRCVEAELAKAVKGQAKLADLEADYQILLDQWERVDTAFGCAFRPRANDHRHTDCVLSSVTQWWNFSRYIDKIGKCKVGTLESGIAAQDECVRTALNTPYGQGSR